MKRAALNRVYALLSVCVASLLATAGWSQTLTFIEPHFGRNDSYAVAVSDDGNAVAGVSVNVRGVHNDDPWFDADLLESYRAFRWTRTGGTQDLGTLGWDGTWAYSISADGQVVVGGYRTGYYAWRAFRWTPSSGMVDLGSLGTDWVDAIDVSSDGSVVVGYSYGDIGAPYWGVFAFRWTQQTGMVNLGTLSGYRFTSGLAVSGDGAIVVGEANLDWAPYWNYKQAWRWTAETGIVGLGIPAGWDSSAATGISADGSTIIGFLHSAADPWTSNPYRAFRWRADTGFQDLGTLGGDRTWVWSAVNRDGTVIYGGSRLANGEWRAFRWTPSTGMQDLNTLYSGAIPDGWVLRCAFGCSSDGRYVVGLAIGPGGVVRGFLLDTGTSSNRPPAVPTLIAPANNARVSSTPTFQLRASDPDGDRVRFYIELTGPSGEEVTYTTGYFASGASAEFFPNAPLSAGEWRWRARAQDSRGAMSDWTQARRFIVDNRPDLVPASLSVSPQGSLAGGKVTIRFEVRNQGFGGAVATKTNVRLSLSAQQPSTSDPLLASLDTPALLPGARHSHEVVVNTPDVQPGTWYIWVIVDVEDSSGQSDTRNDRTKVSFQVIRSPSPPGVLKGIDISRPTIQGEDGSKQFWQSVKQCGVQFVIVQAWGGSTQNNRANAFIKGAASAGLPTAAYCLLNFALAPDTEGVVPDTSKEGTGAWQVQQALDAIGDADSLLSFLAIDVEVANGNIGESTPQQRCKRIRDAVLAVQKLRPGLPVLIYASPGGWKDVTNDTIEFSNLPLWGARYDGLAKLDRDYYDGKEQKWKSFGGWNTRVGKQYEANKSLLTANGTTLIDAVDWNVFDARYFHLLCRIDPNDNPETQ